ncbi:MAG: hypothetical protein ABH878_06750 [bacterium]
MDKAQKENLELLQIIVYSAEKDIKSALTWSIVFTAIGFGITWLVARFIFGARPFSSDSDAELFYFLPALLIGLAYYLTVAIGAHSSIRKAQRQAQQLYGVQLQRGLGDL